MGNNEVCGVCCQAANEKDHQQQLDGNKRLASPTKASSSTKQSPQNPQHMQVPAYPQLDTDRSKLDPLFELPQSLPLNSVIAFSKPNIKQTTSFYPPEQKQTTPNKVNQLFHITEEYGTESALNSNIKLPQNSIATIKHDLSERKNA